MKTYKFKLYSNHGNRELHKTIDGHAHVWNHCVALQRRYYAIYGKYIGKFRLINHISKLKRLAKFVHWHQLPSQAIQDVVALIDKGYKAMFEARAAGKKWGRPRFKPRRKYKSFTLLQAGWELLPGNKIRIGKRIYQYFKSRDVPGNPKRCTIKRDAIGDVYITILTDYEEPDFHRVMTGKIAGFDFGLKRYLTGHNGHDIDSPEFFKRSISAIKRASRNHSQTKKKSKNRERARLDLARKHRKIERQREDFHWKLAHQLTDLYDEIRLEDLNLKGMKRLWGRKVSDLGFADFVVKLKYIAAKKGVKITFIDKWYPSSKTCSVCWVVNDSLNLRDRTWQCSDCGTTHDRDRNAAINIYRVGASTLDGEDVRPSSDGNPC
ncbi:transposase [Candidatus Poribacteria bacterium]|nr:transposase [Candidatus Poribacteria bacterium]